MIYIYLLEIYTFIMYFVEMIIANIKSSISGVQRCKWIGNQSPNGPQIKGNPITSTSHGSQSSTHFGAIVFFFTEPFLSPFV